MTGAPMHIEEALEREGVYVGTTAGTSMWPLLRHRRDTVIIKPCEESPRVHDVILYRRGGDYVLHRVVATLPEGYLTRGDNCLACERVERERVIGVLAGCYRDECEVSLQSAGYRAYVRVWCALYPLRRLWSPARACMGRLARAVCGVSGKGATQ